jgi:hypothetical protein
VVWVNVFPEQWLEVRHEGWYRTANGRLELISVTISSTHDSTLKDFVVACDAIGNSGTAIETVKATTLYESLRPRTKLTIPVLDLGPVSDQTATTKCQVSNATARLGRGKK